MAKPIRIGTRASRLARWQADHVAAQLRKAHPDLEVRIEEFRTAGDRDQATAIARLPGVGFFVKELEAALLDGRIDLAVHAMKDVPTHVTEGLVVDAAVPERADASDCLVTAGPAVAAIADLPHGATVGSSSPRRRAMLLAARPDLDLVDLRGNVETRLRKLTEGQCQATVLARAGLERLGVLDRYGVAVLPIHTLLPVAGQGALGLEFRAGDDAVGRAIAPLDHPPTRSAVVAERALVRRLGAGCRTPLGVLGWVDGGTCLTLEVYLLSPDGRDHLRRHDTGAVQDAAVVGHALAEALLAAGAARLLGSADPGAEAP